MTTDYYEETFGDLQSPADVKISNIRGSVIINAWEKNQVEIKVTRYPDSGDGEMTEVCVYQEEDGQVVAKVDFQKPHGWLRLCQPCKVEFEVMVPAQTRLKVSTVSSSAEINGVEGQIKISAVSGKTQVSDLKGSLNLNSVSGKLIGQNLSGDLDLDSVSGGVRLENCNFETVKAKTVSGGLYIETPLHEEGAYKFSSVSGGVHLDLPDDSALTARISSLSGSIKSSHRATRKTGNRRNQTIDFNGGGVPVRLSSVSGGLKLGKNGNGNMTRPVVQRMSKEERLDILTKLQDGEFSVEDAMTALE